MVARLLATVLGSAAGGGVPQWNCSCAVCERARRNDGTVRARTQTGLAVSGDGVSWTLLNASPDLRAQLGCVARLWPSPSAAGVRASPITAVLLTGGEIDQIAGVLSLRERQPFDLFATEQTLAEIAGNPIFRALPATLVRRRAIFPLRAIPLPGRLTAEAFPVPGKVPLYRECAGESDASEALPPHAAAPAARADDRERAGQEAAPASGTVERPRRSGSKTPDATGASVGVELRSGEASLVFLPGLAAMTPDIRARLSRAQVVLLDGTLFTDDEMIRMGAGERTGRQMGHMPISGAGGSLEMLAGLPARRIYIHMNNTNPILIEDSPERRIVEQAGWEVAYDGQEIEL